MREEYKMSQQRQPSVKETTTKSSFKETIYKSVVFQSKPGQTYTNYNRIRAAALAAVNRPNHQEIQTDEDENDLNMLNAKNNCDRKLEWIFRGLVVFVCLTTVVNIAPWGVIVGLDNSEEQCDEYESGTDLKPNAEANYQDSNNTTPDTDKSFQTSKALEKVLITLPNKPKYQKRSIPGSCQDVRDSGERKSGTYTVTLKNGRRVELYCEMKGDQAWTVFQKRVTQNRWTWKPSQYINGFGYPTGDYWLGLEQLSMLTSNRKYVLKIDLQTEKYRNISIEYSGFSVTQRNFKLYIDATTGAIKFTLQLKIDGLRGKKISGPVADHMKILNRGRFVFNSGWWKPRKNKMNTDGNLNTRNPRNIYWKLDKKLPNSNWVKTEVTAHIKQSVMKFRIN